MLLLLLRGVVDPVDEDMMLPALALLLSLAPVLLLLLLGVLLLILIAGAELDATAADKVSEGADDEILTAAELETALLDAAAPLLYGPELDCANPVLLDCRGV